MNIHTHEYIGLVPTAMSVAIWRAQTVSHKGSTNLHEGLNCYAVDMLIESYMTITLTIMSSCSFC